MADNFLTPGKQEPAVEEPIESQPELNYLRIDNYLSEYSDSGKQTIVQQNLNIPSRDEVYNKTDTDNKIALDIKKAFDKYLNEEDPHGILPEVRKLIENQVRDDGSTPFTAPQKGVDPVQDFHLTTKRFVEKVLGDHTNDRNDPHHTISQVEDILEQYVKQSQIYFKEQLYTKNEIDEQSSKYIKKNDPAGFTRPQIGVDPQIDSHLATKRYVDKVIHNHLIDIDPHGFVALLNNRLASYARANNVYDKSQTYSRVQLDSIIRGLVNDAAKEVIIDHLNKFDPHNVLAEVRKERYIKQDGSIPFRAPQKGVDAIDPQDLITLHQVEEQIANIPESVWITSGPVEATVGMVKEGDVLANSVTLQEALDAIFYGKRVKLKVPEYSNIGDPFPITLCIQGSLATVIYAEVYQDGQYITTISKEQLEESSCVTIDGLPIQKDSEIAVKVFYTNGSIHEISETVKVSLPVFVGKIPVFKFGNTLTYNELQELSLEDSVNNKFYNKGENLQSIEHSYNFDEVREQKLLVALPESYNDLYEMCSSAQAVTDKAFEVINKTPFQIPGSEKDVIYKIYFYKQDLFSLNTLMTFKFK